MNLNIYIPHAASMKEFMHFWSSQYAYEKEHLYAENIGQELNEKRILDLFEWKNGMPLSKQKKESIRTRYVSQLAELPTLESTKEAEGYLSQIGGGVIWGVFWLHCLQPKEFPIYDQHVHRAMATIEGWAGIEIPEENSDKIDVYFTHYIPFWKQFSEFDHRSVDRALWTYGKFLGSGYCFT